MERKDVIYGKNAVCSAIQSGRSINKILISSGCDIKFKTKIKNLTHSKNIIVQEVDKHKIDKIAGTNSHQGILAWVAVKDYISLSCLLNNIKQKTNKAKLVIADGIEDPHNLGAILRTVEVVGGEGVIIPKRRNVGLTVGVAKSSAGAIEYVPVVRVANIGQTIEILKKEGIWIFGLEKEGRNFWEQDFDVPLALVVGSEGKGIRPRVREKCDFLISIPMRGNIDSLNASVVVGIVMYEILRKRGEHYAKV